MALIACPECAGQLSTAAAACPHCGFPVRSGFEYRSPMSLLGWPLLAVSQGIDPATGRKRVAKGWLAVGDLAVGGVAVGGVAGGVIAVGGVAGGLLAVGGVAVGVAAAVGGVALGCRALGGVAVGYRAVGGAAVGRRVTKPGRRAHPLGKKSFGRR